RSDSLSSIAALIGVGFAIFGEYIGVEFFVYGDAVAGLVVSLIVIKVGYELIKSSATIILEKVLSKKEIEIYKKTVLAVDGVQRIDQILARTHGSYVIIDIKISVDQTISVKKGHDIAKETKKALLDKHKEVED